MSRTIHSEPYLVLRTQLIAARKSAGLTQQDLANKLGRPQSFVAKYETGERRLDVVELIEIARAIGTDYLHIVRAVAAEPEL